MSRPTVVAIQHATASHFQLRRSDLLEQNRARVVARPRQIAMMLAYELTGRSYAELGINFHREGKTVRNGVVRMRHLTRVDRIYARDVAQIRARLGASTPEN